MDFSYDDVQEMLADSVRRFVRNDYGFESRQKIAASEKAYSPEVWQTFAELGWTGVPFAEADGGIGGGPVEIMILMREFGRGLVVEPYLETVVLAGGVLGRAASDAQKRRWLAPLIAGELQAAVAFHERQSGYELAVVETRAERNDDGWSLTGAKGVVLNGPNADLLIVSARSSGDVGDPGGITLFAVPADAEGISVRGYPTVDGRSAAEIGLAGVVLGDDAVLGATGDGLGVLAAAVDDATFAVGAEAVGIMQALTEKTVEYTKDRVQFGVPIASFQALQHRMVDMLTACEESESLLLWSAMANADGTPEARRSISALKYYVGTAGRRVGQEAVQLHGGMGVTWELDVAHYFKRLTAIGQLFGSADRHLDRLAAGPETGAGAADDGSRAGARR